MSGQEKVIKTGWVREGNAKHEKGEMMTRWRTKRETKEEGC